MENDTAAIAFTLNRLAAKQIALEAALQAVLETLPQPARTAAAAGLRQKLAVAMQAHATGFSPDMDSTMTLCAAALLEAAGEPPQR